MDRRGKVSLSGASKTENSSQQALHIAKEQRLKRNLKRAQPKAATAIQRLWRGGCCRRAMQAQLRAEWLQRYGALVAKPEVALTAVQLAEYTLPLALLAYKPPQSCTPLQTASLGDTAALRGSFALLLRSLTAQDVNSNLLGLSATQVDRRSALLGQLKRLLTLCCAVVGTQDQLLQAAAARIVVLLCDVQHWICLRENTEALTWLAGALLAWLAPLSMVAQAARRLSVALEAADPAVGHTQQVKAALGNLLNAQLQMALRGDSANPALDIFVDLLLTAPGTLAHAPQPVLAQLATNSVYARLSRCAILRAGRLDGGEALQALAALGSLLTGSGRREQPGAAAEFGAAADALLKRCTCRRGSSPPAAEAVLRLFSDGAIAAQLLAALPLSQFCSLYASLHSFCSATQTSLDKEAPGANAASMRLLSALAFGTSLLPQLWRWLAMNVGLPPEVPSEAKTWEVPSLPHGARSVSTQSAQPFGLFCMVYCHYLSVVDDVDFHEQQAVFTLPQQRAITAALNILVFRTQLPCVPSGAASGGTPGAGRVEVLLLYAPRLLRALYERDSRRRFCPPALWLQPYRSLATGGQGDVSGAAVLRALLQMHQADEEVVGSDNLAGPPYGHRQRPPVSQSAATGLAQLLLQAPQCIPFDERVAVFRGLVALDKEARRYGVAPVDGGPRPARVTVRRSHLLEDALAQLMPLGGAIRGPLSIEFINAHGMAEAGIDMGGLTKELLESVGAAVFDIDRGLFAVTVSQSLYPHPLATAQPAGPQLLCLAGTLLGKALYEGVLLNAPLAPFFVSRLQGRLPALDDLAALDPHVHRGLTVLKRYTGDVRELSLDFTVESDAFGERVSEELIPGGANVAVTNSRRLLFTHLVVDWHLRRRLGPAAAAFAKGLSQVLPAPWLRLFSPGEVNQLLGGGEGASIDLSDMRRHTQYAGGYSSSSRTVALFWKVLAGLAPEDRSALLRFATSCGRAPLGGFEHLTPPFTIYKVPCGASPLALLGGPDVNRLPSASTCTNTLKLPNYRRAETLREKLLNAVRSGAGFDLS